MSPLPRSRLAALFQARCPHCREAKLFRRFLTMHEHCPVCGIRFERETGYFLMAIFIAYFILFIGFLPVLIYLFTHPLPLWTISLITFGGLGILAPLGFYLSRILWLHLDEWLHPHGGSEAPPKQIDQFDWDHKV